MTLTIQRKRKAFLIKIKKKVFRKTKEPSYKLKINFLCFLNANILFHIE